ncbi:sigma-70 family RNA polymerase sigma factor [Chitinophaga sp.]|uniref:RNA polymerase sigma factor n=1 Tax=Chitinophaga sp. TaxID=1869181 RepID=UPI0031D21206
MDEMPLEEELLEKVARGDKSAFTALFHRYQRRIYDIAIRLTHSTIIAEEMVQDIFTMIWLKREDLLKVRDFNAYLFIVTRNEAYRTLRNLSTRRARLRELEEEEVTIAHNNVQQQLLEKEYAALLKTAVSRLPFMQQQVYHLMKEQALKRDEVAERLNIKPETVKRHIAQAMRNIRAYLLSHPDLIIALVLLRPANEIFFPGH